MEVMLLTSIRCSGELTSLTCEFISFLLTLSSVSLARFVCFADNLLVIPFNSGRDSIYVYSFRSDGTLEELAEIATFGEKGHEGPRHSVPSRNGKKLYVVTEHSKRFIKFLRRFEHGTDSTLRSLASYLDVYDVQSVSPYLVHSQRLSVIPSSLDQQRKQYRGDTLRISLDGQRLYVTTRGKTSAEKGFVSVWKISSDGSIMESGAKSVETGYGALHRYETETSGGKANAIEVFPFASVNEGEVSRDWIVLTDDEEGWVSIIEWNNENQELSEMARVQLGRQEGAEADESGTGASHAVWLS
jgi:carboxy-cis,cis-muconate cyclase